MSSGWERIRLRVETSQLPSAEDAAETGNISSHVLDTSVGKAAANIAITLFRLESNAWQKISCHSTNGDGRVGQLLAPKELLSGIYKLHFNIRPYFEANNTKSFYPFIEIIVECQQGQHYHIPLLLNPFGYSTYRGT